MFTVSIGFNNEISDGLGRVDENGPNDAFGVVWAIGESFLILFCFLYILTDVLYI